MPISNFLESFNLFSSREIQKIIEAFSPAIFEEGSYLLQKGEVSDKIYFILEGLLREYSYIEEDEKMDPSGDPTLTHYILGEREWIYQVKSYVSGQKSEYSLQALTKLKAVYIKKEKVNELINEIPNLAFVVINIYERYLLQLETRNAFHRIKNAKKKLEVFEKTQPGIANRVKGKILASYLNITPQQLSRIRGELRNNKE
jgi:CRP-like cAMP-binding protein